MTHADVHAVLAPLTADSSGPRRALEAIRDGSASHRDWTAAINLAGVMGLDLVADAIRTMRRGTEA